MQRSGISYKRYSEFSRKKRVISALYFIKLCGGLGLDPKDVEKSSKRKFSEEQSDSLKFEAFVKANRKWLEILMKDPKKMEEIKRLLGF
jgi:hypothetical protein